MAEYRIVSLGPDGRSKGFKLVFCEVDSQAVDQAKRSLQGSAIEVWCGYRLVAHFAVKQGA